MAVVIMAKAIWNTTLMIDGYVAASALASIVPAPVSTAKASGVSAASSSMSWTLPISPIWSNPPKNGIDPSPPYANDHPQTTHATATTPITATDMIIVFTTFLRRDKPP